MKRPTVIPYEIIMLDINMFTCARKLTLDHDVMLINNFGLPVYMSVNPLPSPGMLQHGRHSRVKFFNSIHNATWAH